MDLFTYDEHKRLAVRLTCPGCGGKVSVKTDSGRVDAQSFACGAHEFRDKNGEVQVMARCRVKQS